jgi:transcriptional regulator with XRE-family HTH domain
MITGVQIRAARNALRWTTQDLAERAGVTSRTIKRFEAVDVVPASRSTTLESLRTVFESAGIEFIGTPDDRPGIRISVASEATHLKRKGVSDPR